MSSVSKRRWIEKQIDAERGTPLLFLRVISISCALVALVLAYIALMPYLDGVSVLDSAEKMERFCSKDYEHASLIYDEALGPQGTFTLSSDESDETEYHVWWLTGDGYTVVYCAEAAFEDNGTLQVQSQYLDMNAQILQDFSPGVGPVYVVYDAGSLVPFMTMLAILILAAVTAALLTRTSFLQKRTQLGRQIAKLGDYRKIVREINRQAEEPLFDRSNCTILKDWALFRTYNGLMPSGPCLTKIVPIGTITDIEIAQDEEDDAVTACRFHVNNGAQPYVIYLPSQEAGEIEALKKQLLVKPSQG